ncbi:OLC1v1019656C1 [Oldenlandia corymbosa var. corymbosa]|uniref:OLC1v1019656C1 n=1 Tax=Oldenlandia corymbosa var. corymbosa TaxID=529605 RepID=A0AAV1EEF7_OLDCO|nr:OLC1v1019656C1 [Oldenlandia corymbosa var. corymbosa]
MAAVRPPPITTFTVAVAFLSFLFLLEVSAAHTPSTLSPTEILAAVSSMPLTSNNSTLILSSSNSVEETDELDSASSVIGIGLPHYHHRNDDDDDDEGFSKYSLKRGYKFLEENKVMKKHLSPKDKDDDGDDDDDDNDDNDDDRDDGDDNGCGDDDEEQEEEKKEKKKLARKFGP